MIKKRNMTILLLSMILVVGSFAASYGAYSEYSELFTGAYDATTRWISPLQNKYGAIWPTVTSKWAEPRSGSGTSPHVGVDLRIVDGKDVVAVQDGTVTALGGTYNTASLSRNGAAPYCHYEHLESVTKTGSVKTGDIIGIAGETGSLGSPHLHFGAYTLNSMSGRKAYRNETFYRDASVWNYGRNIDVFSQAQWLNGRTAKITAVFSGAGNTHSEIPEEVRIYHRQAGTAIWVDGGLMSRSGFDYSYTFSTATYPVGTNIQWMVRIKRNIDITKPYTWAPAKFYNPNTNPNATTQPYAYFPNTIS